MYSLENPHMYYFPFRPSPLTGFIINAITEDLYHGYEDGPWDDLLILEQMDHRPCFYELKA